MIVRACSFAALICVCLLSGCSAHRAAAVSPPSVPVPDARPSEVAAENNLDSAGLQGNEDPNADVPDAASSRIDAAAVASGEVASIAHEPEGIRQAVEDSSLPASTDEADDAEAVEDPADLEAEPAEDNGQNLLDSALDLVNSAQEYWNEGNQDKAIAVLDDAYGLVIRVNTDEKPELSQQKEDLRYMISKRVLEIYASRYTTAAGNYNEIPLTLNEYVEKEIKQFQGPERKYFINSYQRSGKYMPMILQSLKEAGLPEELGWIPLIESGFNTQAYSKARALGLWQFIASTGQKFGLKRDTWVDERMDPEKSTAAAIAYLKELHKIFGDWTTVLAGYNCGEGTVLRKIRNQKINYLDNFWDLFQMLPYETARYVPKFLATLHILKDPAKYGFDLDDPDAPIAYETVTIKKAVQLKAVAATIGATEKELSELNPELRYKATPPTEYALKLPKGKKELLLAGIDAIPKYTPPSNAYVYHSVRKGETLSDIASKYHTSVVNIVRANNIRERDFIRIGQRLKVPARGASVAEAAAPAATEARPRDGKYRVQKGDSLWIIARRFNTDTKKLQQVNGLKDTRLQIGQVLVIPR